MKEQTYNSLLILTILISSFRFSTPQADNNYSLGESCSEFGNSTLLNDAYKSHLQDLQNSLSKSVTSHNGFYKTSVAGEVYGFIQCRADVSATNCANCTVSSIIIARHYCPNSKTATIYARWCFLHYENKDFTGKELDDGVITGTSNGTMDNTYAIAKGEALMGELSRNTSEEPLMFKVGTVDVGKYGKRYGMTECNRDLTRKDCAKCLDKLVSSISTSQSNKRGWEGYSLGCRMWYDDFKFYSDIVISDQPVSSGNRRFSWLGVFSILVLAFRFLY